MPIFNNNGNNQSPNNSPASPSNVPNSSDQQIFVLCSLLATSLFFLLLLILFILFKQRKRHFKNKKATILQLDKLGSEEQQQMLLLMQQQTQTSSLNRTNPPAQILISANNRGYLQQPPPANPPTQPDLLRSEKMHLITRLNPAGTMIDHLLMRNNESMQQQSNSKRISPLNTINNGNNLPVLQQTAISNSNVSGSLTTASVNSNPSHNSSADEEHQMNTATNHAKYNRNHHFDTSKSSPMLPNKFNNFNNGGNLNGKYATNKFLLANQHHRQDSNYAFKIEEPDYAEPMLQSLQSSVGDLEKLSTNGKDGKRSINSQSNSSNKSPSDSDNYDNYDQFEHYEQQYDPYYEKCEQYENANYAFNRNDNYKAEQSTFKEYIETDNLLVNGETEDGYDSLLDQQNRVPPLPKTLPPSSYTMQQRLPYSPAKYNHHTLNYSTDAFNLMTHHTPTKRTTNHFASNTNHLTNGYMAVRNSNRKMQFSTASKLTTTSSTATNSTANSNGTTSNSINKFIEVS